MRPLPSLRHAPGGGLVAVALVATLTAACTSGATASGDQAAGGQLRVVTTVAPLTSIVANVAGSKARVTGLVPEGTNSHTFEPPPSAARVLSEADVVFVNGLRLEDPTRELAEQNLKDGGQIVELGTTVLPKKDYIFDFSFPRSEGKPNPHLWTDPTYVIEYADLVRRTLTKRDPDNGPYYTANYAAFRQKASALAEALRADQATIPHGKRQLLTYHDAYAYFARSFDWQVIGAVQPKDFEDPTPKEIVRLIRQVKASGVGVIFGSEVFPSKVLEQIGRESGARYEDTLRDDDLPGRPGDDAHSLLGLLRYNFATMVEALGGTPTRLAAVDVRDVTRDRAVYPQ